MLVDTHCHLTSPELRPNLDALLARAEAAGVGAFNTVATSPADARAALEIVAGHAGVYLTAGIHPHNAGTCNEEDFGLLAELHRAGGPFAAPAGRLVAVGETGLDFHYDFAPPARQEAVFRRQLELAIAVGRPVVIHARKAEERVCDVLGDYPQLAGRVVFHCFSGSLEVARRILDMGLWLSFTGVVTFGNGELVREAARITPIDRIMVETDAPYMSPEPVRKVRPCEPAFVAHTARRIAQVRGVEPAEFARATTANAARFFGIRTT
jgi:TatD DNase family protein